MTNIVITGASQGIGLEFARAYASGGASVTATCRNVEGASQLRALAEEYPETLRLAALDVVDRKSIEAFAEELKDEAVDLLINNAGTAGPREQSLGSADWDGWLDTFETNVLGQFFVTQALLPNFRKSESAKVVLITSRIGSIELSGGGRYAYRTTKAAANMVARSLAADLQPDGITVVAMHPGWVRTRMGGDAAPIEPSDSAQKMIRVIGSLDGEPSGRFLDLDGNALPW